jgi:hypothetical protein
MGPPFNLLRAAFFLLATVIIAQLVSILGGAATCYWLFIVGRAEVGACSSFTGQAREMWAEVLAAILALLLAGREPPK